MLDRFLKNLFGIPGLIVEFALLTVVAFYQVFELTENKFHEDCLRANPSTEDAAKNHCKQDNEYNERDHTQHKEMKILWPEDNSKEDEFAFYKVEKQQGIAINSDKRPCKEKQQEERCKN